MNGRPTVEQRSSHVLFPIAGAGFGFVMVLSVVVISRVTGEPIGNLTRDITTVCAEAGARLKPYVGIESLANIALWACAATAALIVAALVPQRTRWLVTLAAFLLFLCLDDALSLHEQTTGYLPLPEKSFYVVYAGFALTLAWGSFQAVRSRRAPALELVTLVLGGFFLALSIAVDQLTERHHLVEDGPKAIGACIWLTLPLIYLPELRARLRETDES